MVWNIKHWFAYLGSILSDIGVILSTFIVKILAVVLSAATSAVVWFAGNWLKKKLNQLGYRVRNLLGSTAAEA